MFPDPCTLTAHRAPALLVDAVLACTASGGQVRLRAAEWDTLMLIEGCAQAIAVLHGARGSVTGASASHGYLVAASEVVCLGPAGAYESVLVTVSHGKRFGRQQQHQVIAQVKKDSVITLMHGTLTTMEGEPHAAAQ